MQENNRELTEIIEEFAISAWDVIDGPSRAWLNVPGDEQQRELIDALKKADEACGSCGCTYDAMYKRALVLLGA